MKEQPLFAPGQTVICVDASKKIGLRYGYQTELIEGKRYVIDNPAKEQLAGRVFVSIKGLKYAYNQNFFIPEEFDRYAEETFHQSLKGKPVNA